MGWLWIVLLACAVVVLIGAEWPRLAERFGLEARRHKARDRRKASLTVLRTTDDPEREEFAASVERDLAQLPTTKEHDRKR